MIQSRSHIPPGSFVGSHQEDFGQAIGPSPPLILNCCAIVPFPSPHAGWFHSQPCPRRPPPIHPVGAVPEEPLHADEDKTSYKWSRLEALNIVIALYEVLCRDAGLYGTASSSVQSLISSNFRRPELRVPTLMQNLRCLPLSKRWNPCQSL